MSQSVSQSVCQSSVVVSVHQPSSVVVVCEKHTHRDEKSPQAVKLCVRVCAIATAMTLLMSCADDIGHDDAAAALLQLACEARLCPCC